MTLVGDTGGLYALFDADDQNHLAARRAFQNEKGRLIVPAGILGELDYLLREFLGIDAELSFVDNLISGAFTLDVSTPEDLPRIRELIALYRGLDLGFADASVIATAERLGIDRILTVDERDFRVVRPSSGRFFTLLPADEP